MCEVDMSNMIEIPFEENLMVGVSEALEKALAGPRRPDTCEERGFFKFIMSTHDHSQQTSGIEAAFRGMGGSSEKVTFILKRMPQTEMQLYLESFLTLLEKKSAAQVEVVSSKMEKLLENKSVAQVEVVGSKMEEFLENKSLLENCRTSQIFEVGMSNMIEIPLEENLTVGVSEAMEEALAGPRQPETREERGFFTFILSTHDHSQQTSGIQAAFGAMGGSSEKVKFVLKRMPKTQMQLYLESFLTLLENKSAAQVEVVSSKMEKLLENKSVAQVEDVGSKMEKKMAKAVAFKLPKRDGEEDDGFHDIASFLEQEGPDVSEISYQMEPPMSVEDVQLFQEIYHVHSSTSQPFGLAKVQFLGVCGLAFLVTFALLSLSYSASRALFLALSGTYAAAAVSVAVYESRRLQFCDWQNMRLVSIYFAGSMVAFNAYSFLKTPKVMPINCASVMIECSIFSLAVYGFVSILKKKADHCEICRRGL